MGLILANLGIGILVLLYSLFISISMKFSISVSPFESLIYFSPLILFLVGILLQLYRWMSKKKAHILLVFIPFLSVPILLGMIIYAKSVNSNFQKSQEIKNQMEEGVSQ